MIVLIIIAVAGSLLFYFLQPPISEHSNSFANEQQDTPGIHSETDLPSYSRIQL
ncbi:hypothetical protein ACFPYJ_13360 [Paenibacillus solisilvae]|uniref:Uncharacterized protein n=1 Tax=Paenibacillus solisilvae TaxID=2486751 RepID=A0ABW0VW78_9BACL